MRNFILLFVVFGAVIFSSCKKGSETEETEIQQPKSDLESLENTYWKYIYLNTADGSWMYTDELVFHRFNATYTITIADEVRHYSGPYTYDPQAGIVIMTMKPDRSYPSIGYWLEVPSKLEGTILDGGTAMQILASPPPGLWRGSGLYRQ